MSSYKFLEDEATADIAFEAESKTIASLIETAAAAVTDIMADLKSIRHSNEKIIKLKESSYADLLLKFLEELVFLKDAENLLFSKFKVSVKKKGSLLFLEAKCSGEEINRERHKLKIDVKAITYHHFKLTHSRGVWKAKVLVDI